MKWAKQLSVTPVQKQKLKGTVSNDPSFNILKTYVWAWRV